MGPPVELVDGILRDIVLILQVRKHQVRHIIENIGLTIELNSQYCMGDVPDIILKQHNTHVVCRESKFTQSVILGDAVIFTVSG
jgi:hypothetical protein